MGYDHNNIITIKLLLQHKAINVMNSNLDGHIPSGQIVQRAVVEDTGIGMFHVYKCTERK